ncbi:glyoxalase/bleomycin resistance/extradiol dioxygenase family protein [Streptomyces sp. 2221.1]|uniref:VOC family protein n=1 Tax=Streptomyces sp. 2221.1 TaxID=1938837 RepID=UPI00216256DD|nr:VOC family protein [Streptomyces sp. 2221.1]
MSVTPSKGATRVGTHGARTQQPDPAPPHRSRPLPRLLRRTARPRRSPGVRHGSGAGHRLLPRQRLPGGLRTLRHSPHPGLALWIQVEDAAAAHEELGAKGVEIVRPPVKEPWGLVEMWIADPDGTRIVLVEVPAEHPLRYRPGI